ncbi:hypothetical protein [Brumimicrobium aurantiacum]|nr:hypothetical protein [Brumimicrobium aurantiacum]
MKKAFIISLGLSLGIVSAYGQERTPPTSAELIEKWILTKMEN